MAKKTSIDFIPEIFKTPTNTKFLNSTLDQLVQEPELKIEQGYVGKRTNIDKITPETYIKELSQERANYQLEPGVVFSKNNVKVDALTYPGMVDALQLKGAKVENHNRLFSSEAYSWSPLIDFDKLVNYTQYQWIPEGLPSVDVSSTETESNANFIINRDEFIDSYTIGGLANNNPPITVVRGGSYTFTVDQPGFAFYIQSQPGVDGVLSWSPNISSRDVLGVSNNGADDTQITFDVPELDEQLFFHDLTNYGPVDIASDELFDDINGQPLDSVFELNEIRNVNTKLIVFLTDQDITVNQTIYQIQIIYDTNGENPVINLYPYHTVTNDEKFTIQYGEKYSNKVFYKPVTENTLQEVPLLTASLDRLYYQDANDPNMFGVINVIDQDESSTLFISDIVGQETYTSPNGVEFTSGLKVKFKGAVEPEEFIGNEYYIEGVGSGIVLVPVADLITPEEYTNKILIPWDTVESDSIAWDADLPVLLDPDYITINRASMDLNAWTRSNRWFHNDVVLKTIEYNNQDTELQNVHRAKRPIIEFEPNIRLVNNGTKAKKPINIVDFEQEDALSNVNGQASYSIDGFELEEGMRVVFSADQDPNVRNKIYVVEMIDMNNDGDKVINLVLAEDAEAKQNETLVVLNGATSGVTFSFSDGAWTQSQLKTSVNQSPLFDVYDTEGISLSNQDKYQSTSFTGTKLFSYQEGTGENDPYLGFPLSYKNIGNLGDILFDNNLYSDTFVYVDSLKGIDDLIHNDGFIRQYSTRLLYDTEVGWVKSADFGYIPQVFNSIYDGQPVVLDVLLKKGLVTPGITVNVNNTFLTTDHYEVSSDGENTILTFAEYITVGDRIEIIIVSDDISEIGFYQVPNNLTCNVFNENSDEFTLGTVRSHFNGLAQNITGLTGNINGANNSRDLGEIDIYGDIIMQQSAPMTLIAQFIRSNEYNFFDSLKFNSRAYEKLKSQILSWVASTDIFESTTSVGGILDNAFASLNVGKTSDSAFFNSDMLPTGTDFETTNHEVTAISTDSYSTLYTYDFTKANTQALLVYVNNELQVINSDYIVATDGPRVTFLRELEIGDLIDFREYQLTFGSFVPNTPTKMGLYRKYEPMKYLDNTYSRPTEVIRGHDGSITIAFGDIRDEILLEFETRIYNNIKVNQDIPIKQEDILQGQFRDTDYLDNEITEILSPDLLSWLGWNKIDYKTQEYRANDEKTWNYGKSGNKLDDRLLKGHWRGIYKFYYDTDSPHLFPWEMLGFSIKPDWWDLRYGPAPYTSGNKNLWDDLELGLIKDPDGEYISEEHARPGLSKVIPVDSEGRLLTPLENMAANYSSFDFKASWKIGDQAPAETAFRRSSTWPFAFQRLLALTKPAQYFALMADRDRYRYDYDLDQYLYDQRLRLDSRQLEIVNNTTPKNSYVNWVSDYNIHYGYNSIDDLSTAMADTNVNLCYRLSGFTDKKHLKIFTDKSSPDSTNSSLLIPDESYDLLLYKNQPFDEIIYSAVTIQKVEDGYTVIGNSKTSPYFKIMQSLNNGNYKELTVGRFNDSTTTVRLPLDFSDTIVYVPYNHVFTNIHLVVDFIVSYGQYLTNVGLNFLNVENTIVVNWASMASEFIYWQDQGWEIGSTISLNPAANTVEFEREFSVVNNLMEVAVTEQPQDQNGLVLDSKDFAIDRLQNNFKLVPLNNKVLGYLNFQLTSFEHLLILDNVSIFNDLMYDPVTCVRHDRIKLHGFISDNWTGIIEAPGFMLNEDNVKEWTQVLTYNKGNLVKFKNEYWTANETIESSSTFDYTKWTKVDYDTITKGMIANTATKSQSMLSYYDNHIANLEQDADLLAFGLTGFRAREYLAGLDLDDISQVNIYRDLIENKGTNNSLDLFKDVNFNNASTNYDVLENWAVRRATYGATSSRAFFDLWLDETKHAFNPTTVQIVRDPAVESDASQIVTLKKIFKQSVNYTDSNILPLLEEKITDVNLPYAGFVDRDDVDIAIFSLNDLDAITEENKNIVDGTLIWVAKDTEYDWNVYRSTAVIPEIIKVYDNLNSTLTFEFNGAHNLCPCKIIIVKYFDTQINGTYNVLDISHPKRVTVLGSLTGDQTQITDNGVCFVLTGARLDVPSDIVDSRYDYELFLEDKVWIKDDYNKAAVYSKIIPYEYTSELQNIDINYTNTEFGHAVDQSIDGAVGFVTEPFNGAGYIHVFNRTKNAQFEFNGKITITGIASNGYNQFGQLGTSMSMATKWGVVGAPANNGQALIIERDLNRQTVFPTQIVPRPPEIIEVENIVVDKEYYIYQSGTTDFTSLGAPDSEIGTYFVATSPGIGSGQVLDILDFNLNKGFGTDTVISDDENWIYASEPANNVVYSFQKVEYQDQDINYIADGYTLEFSLNDEVIVDTADQIVVLNNLTKLTPDVDYTLDDGVVIMTTMPHYNDRIYIARNTRYTEINNVANKRKFNVSGLYMFNNSDSIIIKVNAILQRLGYDYLVDAADQSVTFFNGLEENDVLLVETDTYFKHQGTITWDDVNLDDKFGYKIDTNVDGSEIVISAPNRTVDGVLNVGTVLIFNRVINRFVVDDVTQSSYTVNGILPYPASQHLVHVNGNLLETELTNNPEYYTGLNEITLNYPDIKVGDFLDVDVNSFNLVQETTIENVGKDANYGSAVSICRSNCSVYVGADGDSTVKILGGSVQRLINEARTFGTLTSNVQNPFLTNDGSIRINRVEVILQRNLSLVNVSTIINNMVIPNVTSSVANGYLTIELINKELTSLASKLEVKPGDGNVFYELGLEPYSIAQTITSPKPENYSRFGSDVEIDRNGTQLIIAAVNGTTYKLTAFDGRETTFDGKTMRIIDDYIESGAVYSYDLLHDETAQMSGAFAFGQQLYDNNIEKIVKYVTADTTELTADSTEYFKWLVKPDQDILTRGVNTSSRFGQSVSSINGTLIIGSPGYDYPGVNAGRALVFEDEDSNLSWNPIRLEQNQVDVSLINGVNLYDAETEESIQYLDYIDPLNGKILGVAQENLDYVATLDPAVYKSSRSGTLWGQAQLGEMWWDTQNVRFLEYHYEDINHSNKLWGKVFPGSAVEVYQWIKSETPPFAYTGEGTPKNESDFVAVGRIGANNIIVNDYYFWVRGIREISENIHKTLSPTSVALYIESPSSSGIPYASFIKPNTIGLTNINNLIDEKTILHVQYDLVKNDNKVFYEYDLIREDSKTDFLSESMYTKLQDSFCGVDSLGNKVPDVKLSAGERYGINYRPRQSMFIDRYKALKSYIDKVNLYLSGVIILDTSNYVLLNSQEPEPLETDNTWDLKVQNLQELSYQDINALPAGYRILVENNDKYANKWTIYEVIDSLGNKFYRLVRVQYYDTTHYWNHINWYADGVNELTRIDAVVDIFNDLQTVEPGPNKVTKVLYNSANKWELYRYNDDTGWVNVGIEDGTIEISSALYDYGINRFGYSAEVYDTQLFDEEPIQETRNIIRSLNEEVLTGNFQSERINALISVFTYVLSEQPTADWVYKTSLLDVVHSVRSLTNDYTYNYKKDNQDYVFDYIEESKPYHCKIKDFLLSYTLDDLWNGTVTDFDCPSYYNHDFKQYISPVLDAGAILKTDPSNATPSDEIWKTQPWDQWFNNHAMRFTDVIVTNQGSGYTTAPLVVVIGDADVSAELTAIINLAGGVSKVTVENPGLGYKSTPIIQFTGGNGTGAAAVAVTTNSLVRSLGITMKYDRYEYNSTVIEWLPEIVHLEGDNVRYENVVYTVLETNSDAIFEPEKYAVVDIESLGGVDRTLGYYSPDANSKGIDLGLLISGINYPGVDVKGLNYNMNYGYDEPTGLDSRPFDLVGIGPDGYVTYNDTVLDAIYESDYLDSYLGTRPTDVNVVGGEYIDRYHSHAPEELIPGATFDTLDIRVFSVPGWDYSMNGYAFNLFNEIHEVEGDSTYRVITADNTLPSADSTHLIDADSDINIFYTFSFEVLSNKPVTILVHNMTTGKSLYEHHDFTIDWGARTITLTDGVDAGDSIKIKVSDVGGGKQLFNQLVLSEDIINNEYLVPFNIHDIKEVLVYEDGVQLQNISTTFVSTDVSKITFSDSFTDESVIVLVILGVVDPNEDVLYPGLANFEENLYQLSTWQYLDDDASLFNQSYFNDATFYDPNNIVTNFVLEPDHITGITSEINAVVELNGERLRPPAGIRYVGDGRTVNYDLPKTSNPDNIVADDVLVIYNNTELVLDVDYTLTMFEEISGTNPLEISKLKYITLVDPMQPGTTIEIYVETDAEYDFIVNGNNDELILSTAPDESDLVNVVSYGDTSELDLLTTIFTGSTLVTKTLFNSWDQDRWNKELWDASGSMTLGSTGEEIIDEFINLYDLNPVLRNEGYDQVRFDSTTGFGFDGSQRENSSIYKTPIVAERLWVTLNGRQLSSTNDYIVLDNRYLFVYGPTLESDDVLVVTSMTNSSIGVNLGGTNFRYFKDMRENRTMHTLSETVRTKLVQDLLPTGDEIYVRDSSVLTTPDISKNMFGVVTIDGERITYRHNDEINNVLSGLRRGTAGTGVTYHWNGAPVYNLSKPTIVPGTDVAGIDDTFITSAITINPDMSITTWIKTDDCCCADANSDECTDLIQSEVCDLSIEHTLQDEKCYRIESDIIYVDNVLTLGNVSLSKIGSGKIIIDNYEIAFETRNVTEHTLSGLTVTKIEGTYDPVYEKEYETMFGVGTAVNDMIEDVIWYEGDGINASNGLPLSEQTTNQATFLKK